MADVGKVIKGLNHCLHGQECCGDEECPYYIEHESDSCWLENCQENLKADALVLLKEQEAVEPTSYMDGLVQRFACGKCGKHLLYAKWGRDDFCSKCGRAVKWE